MATEVLLAGWGQKEGSRRKNWKRRYFILRTAHPDESRASGCTHTLVYYKTEEDATGLRAAYRGAPAGAVPLIKNKTAPIPVQKKIKGVPTQCLLIKTPGHRDFFVSPEAPLAEWSDMISKLEPPPNAADLRHQTIGDRPVEAVKLDDPEVPEDDEEEESPIVHSPKEALAANAKIELHPDGVLSSLSAHSHSVHPESHTKAVLAPEEADRVPMLQRGVTLAFLRRMVKELTAHGRGGIDCGQFLNGTHTTSSATDWKEFSREKDALCGKACTLHTGTSFVETCITAGLTHDPETGAPFFGAMDTFVSYTWRGDGITLANLVTSVEETLVADPLVKYPEKAACFVDVFVCAQHRGVRPKSNSCPNATDVGKFEEVVSACTRLVLYCTPLTKPKALTRVWCLYEIMSAIKRECPVNVALSAEDRAELRRLLYEDFDKLIALFTTIKSEQAEATFDSDRVMVFGWIERDLGNNGFNQLDQLVGKGMRLWLAESAKKMVTEAEQTGKGGTEDIARLMNECGRLLTLLAKHGEAEQLIRRALALYEKLFGKTHYNVAATCHNLGDLLRAQAKLQEAEPAYRRAVDAFMASPLFGPSHSRTSNAMGLLGLTLKELGRMDEAEPLLRRAIELSSVSNGPEHQDTATHMNNLAHVLKIKGQVPEAKDLYQRSMAIYEKVHGPEHPSLGIAIGNYAETLRETGDLEDSEVMFRRALKINEAAYGAEHPEVGTTVNNLGSLLLTRGKLEEAEACLRRALKIEEVTHGSGGGDTATVTNNLASVLRDQGKYDEAAGMFQKVRADFEATLGPNHLNTATATNNLAGTLRDKGDFDAAEQLYSAAIAVFQAQVGADHPNTIYIQANLGRTIQLRKDNRSESGRAMVEQCLRRLVSPPFSLPNTHPWVVKLSKWVPDVSTEPQQSPTGFMFGGGGGGGGPQNPNAMLQALLGSGAGARGDGAAQQQNPLGMLQAMLGAQQGAGGQQQNPAALIQAAMGALNPGAKQKGNKKKK